MAFIKMNDTAQKIVLFSLFGRWKCKWEENHVAKITTIDIPFEISVYFFPFAIIIYVSLVKCDIKHWTRIFFSSLFSGSVLWRFWNILYLNKLCPNHDILYQLTLHAPIFSPKYHFLSLFVPAIHLATHESIDVIKLLAWPFEICSNWHLRMYEYVYSCKVWI